MKRPSLIINNTPSLDNMAELDQVFVQQVSQTNRTLKNFRQHWSARKASGSEPGASQHERDPTTSIGNLDIGLDSFTDLHTPLPVVSAVPVLSDPISQVMDDDTGSGIRGSSLPFQQDESGQFINIGIAISTEDVAPGGENDSLLPRPLRNRLTQDNHNSTNINFNPTIGPHTPSTIQYPLESFYMDLFTHDGTNVSMVRHIGASSDQQPHNHDVEEHRCREPPMVTNTVDASQTREYLLGENKRLEKELRDLRDAFNRVTVAKIDERISTEPVLSDGKSTKQKVKGETERQESNHGTTTLRDLILKKLFAASSPQIPNPKLKDEELGLDTPLTPVQVKHFQQLIHEIAPNSETGITQRLAVCTVCKLPKFRESKGPSHSSLLTDISTRSPSVSSSLIDFHPLWGVTKCCRKYVCNPCLIRAILAGIQSHWWFDLANAEEPWLKCPIPGCAHSLPLRYNCDLLGALHELGVQDAISHVQEFERANRLRPALCELHPGLTKKEARRSTALHDRLVQHSRMWPLLRDPPPYIDTGPVQVELLPVDTADGQHTMQIPIFTHLLRPRLPRECIVCADTHLEFDRGSPQQWSKAAKGFGGEWIWRILSFPVQELLLECNHAFDICRNCIAMHIHTQLETHGRNAVDNIACPTPNCKHKYTYSEIRHLATSDDFSAYDRFTVLNTICLLPNFRWCLREGCTAGGLYDDPATTTTTTTRSRPSPMRYARDSNKIMCSECAFEMCYACQTPWHAGATCAQHESQKAHGDPQYARTRDWISQHTKSCPGAGCGVPVEKGSGCFHMTCSGCKFEFCWECLAGWDGIVVRGEFRREGHHEGCYFRGETAALPTQVLGRNLERALNRAQARRAARAGVVG